jgi:predicted N-formylglutamate amidohydrolase
MSSALTRLSPFTRAVGQPGEFESAQESFLGPDEATVFEVIEDRSNSPFLITCDHAGRQLPRSLGSLGLPESDLLRHIAWDIGASGVARFLAADLGAFAIRAAAANAHATAYRPRRDAQLYSDFPGRR